MSKISAETHEENLLNIIDFKAYKNDFEYYSLLKKKKLGVKIYFNDGSYIKGAIEKATDYTIYLRHKKNILQLMKSNIKLIEPLPND